MHKSNFDVQLIRMTTKLLPNRFASEQFVEDNRKYAVALMYLLQIYLNIEILLCSTRVQMVQYAA